MNNICKSALPAEQTCSHPFKNIYLDEIYFYTQHVSKQNVMLSRSSAIDFERKVELIYLKKK